MYTRSFLYDQVADLIIDMIQAGTLPTGSRAPSLRALGRQLNVSVATVMQAYEKLETLGYLQARSKSGFYVEAMHSSQLPALRWSRQAVSPHKVQLGKHMNEILASARAKGVMPLGIANPAIELLPCKALTRALRRVSAGNSSHTLCYAPIQGEGVLRSTIARRAISRGMQLSVDDVLVTTGATEALSLCLRAVAQPGDVIAVESPAYFSVLQLIESLGMLALEIGTHPRHGLTPDSLERVIARQTISAVVSVATFNNPTGSLVPAEAKRDIVELLAQHQIPLIEDDIYGDLHYAEQRPPTYKSFDLDSTVICCSSFSKTIAPGYRIGWLIAHQQMRELLDLKLISSSATPSLTQLAIADFLNNSRYDRHLNRMRRACHNQTSRMRQAILEYFPEGTRVSEPSGGYVLWVQLPRVIDTHRVYRDAIAVGISITPGALFSSSGKFRNFMRLCAGMPWSDEIQQAIARLGHIISHQANN